MRKSGPKPPPPPAEWQRALREACEVAQQRGEIKANVRALGEMLKALERRTRK